LQLRRTMEASDLSAAAVELRATLGALGIAQRRVAQLFNVGPRTVRRWQYGDRRVPCGVGIVLRLLAAGTVTVAQVEQAAVPIPARTNGSAQPGPPAPLLGEPAPEQSALASAKVATLADPSLTTAEKACALTPEVCCWPCGDPGHPDFTSAAVRLPRGPTANITAPWLRGAADRQRTWRPYRARRSWVAIADHEAAVNRSVNKTSTDPVDGFVDRPVDESIAAQA
jgi:hypothetical protein